MIKRNKYRQLLADGVAVVLENRISLAMPCAVRVVLANGKRGGCPHPAGVLVTQINGLGLRIGHRIVLPGGESVLLAVRVPCVSQSALGNHAAEVGSRNHIGPRSGRSSSGAEINRILPAVLREPSNAVEVVQFEEWQRGRRLFRDKASQKER